CARTFRTHKAVVLFGVLNVFVLLAVVLFAYTGGPGPASYFHDVSFSMASQALASALGTTSLQSPDLRNARVDRANNASVNSTLLPGTLKAGSRPVAGPVINRTSSVKQGSVANLTTSAAAVKVTSSAAVKVTSSAAVNVTSSASAVNATSSAAVRNVTTPVADVRGSSAKLNSTPDSENIVSASVWGAGQPMTVLGNPVSSRANVTAPWLRDETKQLCPTPTGLVGRLSFTIPTSAPDPNKTVALNPGLEPGGHYHPPDCRARHRVAIIIPYRNRTQHLHGLLHHLHPILRRQLLDYFILVVELAMPTTFNRGMLLNIGAVEAVGLWDVQCFIFHDVDLMPEDDRNLYTCPDQPRHMSAAVDKFRYRLPYPSIVGGVTAVKKEQFSTINGYSNLYFGWGGEDDDLYLRLTGGKLKITRYPLEIARYRMYKHNTDANNAPNPERGKLLNPKWVKERQPKDGLSSLQYEVKGVEFRPGYTWMLVSVDKDKILNAHKRNKPTAQGR
ncbi:hypothetical protein BaRGS_00022730, partial [Batillaria attramentaria]